MRWLIVNADDFGLTSGVNRGILEAHTHGIVTSATLMAGGSKFQEAAALAAQVPELSVGCHVVLVDGVPTLNATKLPSLTAGPDGCFRQSLIRFAGRATTGRLDPAQIEAEITAQIRKLQAAGIRVSHIDSHKHTHMFPAVFKPLLRASKACGVRAVRNPFEPLVFAMNGNWKRRFKLGILRRYQAGFARHLADAGMVTPNGCIGIVATGGLTLAKFTSLIENLPEGTWEFVSHPGYNDADLDRIATRLRDSRDQELAILTSESVKELIRREGIDLISYREFAEGQYAPEVHSPSTGACD
jgi:chitin disaccharide deacetylase